MYHNLVKNKLNFVKIKNWTFISKNMNYIAIRRFSSHLEFLSEQWCCNGIYLLWWIPGKMGYVAHGPIVLEHGMFRVNTQKFRVNSWKLRVIRESNALIRESFALIRESYAISRESFAFICEIYKFFPTKMSSMGFCMIPFTCENIKCLWLVITHTKNLTSYLN